MLLATLIAIGGLGILVGYDFLEDRSNYDSRHLFGDILVVVAGLAIVIAIIIGRSLRQTLTAPVYTSAVFSIAGCTCFAWAVAFGQSFSGDGPEDWLWLACLILVPTIAGHCLFNYLVKHVSVFSMNFVILVEPVISTAIKWMLNDQRHFGVVDLSPAKVAGAAVLIGGVGLGLVLREKVSLMAEQRSEQ